MIIARIFPSKFQGEGYHRQCPHASPGLAILTILTSVACCPCHRVENENLTCHLCCYQTNLNNKLRAKQLKREPFAPSHRMHRDYKSSQFS